eukprot:3066063-Rhodomonas_salina.4
MFGTNVAYGATAAFLALEPNWYHPPYQPISLPAYAFPTRCPVLKYRIRLRLSMRCLVLKFAMLLRDVRYGRYATTTDIRYAATPLLRDVRYWPSVC